MIPATRAAYNKAFSQTAYENFTAYCSGRFHKKIEFKICETPVFIPSDIKSELIKAGEEIIAAITNENFRRISSKAVPSEFNVPGDEGRPVFIALDFGLCEDGTGKIVPQLIEMQGFASLYCWQHELAMNYRKFFSIPDHLSHLFEGLDATSYIELLRKTIIGNHKPEEVILLEIEPDKQKTWVDFYLTREAIGIEPVCISKVIREGRELFYMRDGVKIKIRRIYDRLIFDELSGRDDLKRQWNLTEEADVEWVSHPNWFFRISKYTLPFIKSKYVPETHFLHELQSVPNDLENWVLKPLFSFAGHGVVFNVTPSDIEKVMPHAENFILQRKVNYGHVIETPDEAAKCEIRMMYIWEPDKHTPTLVINLVRLSKGVMIGVDYNKNKTWVGGTVGFFE